jgi:hypothetical protein
VLTLAFPFAAFTEEIVCRGYILQNMRDIGQPLTGVIISSAIFTLFHSLNPGVWANIVPVLSLFLTGVLLALLYILSGNIWFPTAVHFVWNATEGPVLGTRVSGMPVDGLLNFEANSGSGALLTGGQFGIEGSVVLVVAQSVLIGVLLIILWRRTAKAGEVATKEGSGGAEDAAATGSSADDDITAGRHHNATSDQGVFL